MARTAWFARNRLLIALLAASLPLSGFAAASAMSHVRGALAPSWVDQISHPDADRVALQFDIDLAVQRRTTLPDQPCWPCRLREALASDPLSGTALRVLAMYDENARENDAAADKLALATQITRRDIISQVWLAEFYRRRGDIENVMASYDRLLTVKPSAAPLVDPWLRQSLGDPRVQTVIAKYIRQQRPWIPEFLDSAISENINPQALAATFALAATRGPANQSIRPFEESLVATLASGGQYRLARSHAKRLLGDSGHLIDRLDFIEPTMDDSLRPLLWSSGENDGLTSGLIQNGVVRVEALSGARGISLYRVLTREPGRYRLTLQMSRADDLPPISGSWTVICLAGGAGQLSEVSLPKNGVGTISMDFSIPSSCDALRIALTAANTGTQPLAGADFSKIALSRFDL